MRLLVVYDISHDGTRTKIADICQDYGLDRIQYSAFLGDLSRVHQEELMEKAADRLGTREGKIYLYPICGKDWQNKIEIKQVKDEE
jgi:CRISPR-associated protein Cas2